MIVLDGNMKNQREVCKAKDGGYLQFPGLFGKIKTGCTATPAYNSRYCGNHTPYVVKSTTENVDDSERIVEVVLGKKITRNQTYYQVRDYNNCNVLHAE